MAWPTRYEDADADGLTNRQEYVLGTHPRQADTRRRRHRRRQRGPRQGHAAATASSSWPARTRWSPTPIGDGQRDDREDAGSRRACSTSRSRAAGTQPRDSGHRQRRLERRQRGPGGDQPILGRQPPDDRRRAALAAGRPEVPGLPGLQRLERAASTRAPVASNSATMIAAIGLDRGLHMDFGSYAGYGIPYQVVTASTPRSTVVFDYDDESDHVGYPIPASPKIEGGSDRHILMVDRDACRLYELFAARKTSSALARRQRRDLGPALQRAAAGRLDERRCRRPADPARPRPLRRGRRRRDPARAAVHDQPDPQGLHLPGPPPRQRLDLDVAAAHGPAGPPQGRPTTRPACRPTPGSSPRRSSATG